MLTLIRLDRENRRLRTAHAAAPNSASSACLVDRRGRVRWTSPALRVRLPPRGGRRGHGAPHLDVLDHVAPGIAAAVRSRIGDRNTGQARAGHGMTGPGGVTIESVLVGDRGDPHLLIRIGEPRQSTMEVAPRTWALMAQRVAHALKNPLTSMLLTLRRLEMEYREHAPAAASRLDRYSGRLEERIEELRRLTSNFLKFVDVELPRLESIDANAIVREYGALIERTRPPDIRLDVRLGPHLPRIQADEDQLLAALENLVANAVDAMPDGGLITLSTQLSRGMRWTGDEGARDYVTIEVADTGTGIAEDIKPRLFEPGWSGRQDGSGLGLAIVHKVMRDHGGQITFESEVGSGSAFTMFLPTVGVIDGGASGEPARFGRSMEEHVAQS
jgi:hypothetical protein